MKIRDAATFGKLIHNARKKAGADPNTTGGDCAGAISLYPDDMPDLDEELAEITDDKLIYKILNVKQFSVAKK